MTDIQQRPEPRFKSCPWCGLEPEGVYSNIKTYFYVGCDNNMCPVQPETGFENSEEEARSVWNTCVETDTEQRLTAANERVLISQQVSDSMLAKYVAEHALTVRMLKALKTFVDHFGDPFQEAHAVIAEAEAGIQGGE